MKPIGIQPKFNLNIPSTNLSSLILSLEPDMILTLTILWAGSCQLTSTDRLTVAMVIGTHIYHTPLSRHRAF